MINPTLPEKVFFYDGRKKAENYFFLLVYI